jgi:hypothetical protein
VKVDDGLRRELLAWVAEDEATRERLAREGKLFEGYHEEMEAVHRRNAERLEEVIRRRGWPGRTVVGEEGASAAWRIAQHAIGEPARMRAWLALLRDAVACREADARELAMMEDRVRVLEGRLQRYGTQLDWNDAGDAMEPMVGVEDPERVDERRRAVGLGPMEWRRRGAEVAEVGEVGEVGEVAPKDVAARREAMEEWARRVGWR